MLLFTIKTWQIRYVCGAVKFSFYIKKNILLINNSLQGFGSQLKKTVHQNIIIVSGSICHKAKKKK